MQYSVYPVLRETPVKTLNSTLLWEKYIGDVFENNGTIVFLVFFGFFSGKYDDQVFIYKMVILQSSQYVL